jgi:hypothetical protein
MQFVFTTCHEFQPLTWTRCGSSRVLGTRTCVLSVWLWRDQCVCVLICITDPVRSKLGGSKRKESIGLRFDDWLILLLTRQATYSKVTQARSWNHYCKGKAISITQPECSSAAVDIHHAMRMRPTVICGRSRSTQCFPTLSHKRQDFRERKKSYCT